MSDRTRGEGHNVKATVRGQGTMNDSCATAVGNPARHAIKVGDIITALIQRRDRQQVDFGVRDEEHICQGQMVTGCHGDLNGAHTDGLDGASPEPFYH